MRWNNPFLVCWCGREQFEVRRRTSAHFHVCFYPCDQRCPAVPSHSDVFTEKPAGRRRQRASMGTTRLWCKPRGQLVSLRRANTSKRGGGTRSRVRRWQRLLGVGGRTRSDVWVDETLSRTSQLERRMAERRRGPTQTFCFLNLQFFHYSEQKTKVEDGRSDREEKHIMRLYMRKVLLN